MYPNLRYAFYDMFGLDLPFLGLIQSFGFFLALSFFVAAWVLTLDLKRREGLGLLKGQEQTTIMGQDLAWGSLLGNAVLGFLIGFKVIYAIQHPDLFASDEAKRYFLSWEHGYWAWGLALALIFPAYRYWEWRKEREQYPKPTAIKRLVMPHERVGDIIVVAAISGVLGAKLLYLIEYYDPRQSFFDQLFNGSGLVVYGGLIFAFIVVSLYIRRLNIPWVQLTDAAAPPMMIAYGIGRMGCHFSGDGDWGDPNPQPKPFTWLPDWLWAYKYPNNVIYGKTDDGLNQPALMADCGGYPPSFGDYCYELEKAVYPTPVWELLICTFLFFILWKLRPWAKVDGLLFSIYLMFNGLERFSIEVIRINPNHYIEGIPLSQAQWIACILFVIGLGLFIPLFKKQLNLNKIEQE